MGHEGGSKYQRPNCHSLLFDLDDTLYPANSGIGADVMKNIQDYMVQKLRIDESISLELCVLLYKQYGTTMAGLRVFTNGDRIHASRALQRLGIEGCFEGVVCFETLNPTSPAPAPSAVPANEAKIFDIMKHLADPQPRVELPKSPILCRPSIDAMLHALELANINPLTTVFFDDSIRNIQAGKQIGMHTVLVGTSQRIKGADHALESIHNLKEALPELWEEAVKDEDVRNSSKVGIETSVIA